MTTVQPDQHARPSRHPFRGFDQSTTRLFGADLRLLYGMAVPILMIIGMIILLALSPTTWLAIAILLLEITALGIVLSGLFGMLDEDEQDEIS
jgi:hypothetical protein